MDAFSDLFEGFQPGPNAVLDIALTAVLIYGVLSLIQGTRAVRLVVGAIVVYVVFVVAQGLDLILLANIMQTGAVVGLVALVVIFQPELRRGLDRLGRVGSLAWLAPSDAASHQRVAATLASAAATLSRRRVGALVVIERDTGLGDMAETGVPVGASLSADLLTTLFEPGSALHDGAAVVAGDKIVAAGVMLPLAQRMSSRQRYGTRHRAAVGVTEQTDALAIVVSEETGNISLAVGGGISHGLSEEDLRQRLFSRLNPADIASTARSVRSFGLRQRGGATKKPDATAPVKAESPTVKTAPVRPPDEGAPSTGSAGTTK